MEADCGKLNTGIVTSCVTVYYLLLGSTIFDTRLDRLYIVSGDMSLLGLVLIIVCILRLQAHSPFRNSTPSLSK